MSFGIPETQNSQRRFGIDKDADKGTDRVCVPALQPHIYHSLHPDGTVTLFILNITQVTEKESTEYFRSRPRGSQVGAWALHQSRPVESRGSLETNVKDVQVLFVVNNLGGSAIIQLSHSVACKKIKRGVLLEAIAVSHENKHDSSFHFACFLRLGHQGDGSTRQISEKIM